MARLVDMIGKKIGRLKVIRRSGVVSDGRAGWLCVCECGTKKVVSGKTMRSGDSLSCGCLHRESSIRNLPDTLAPIGKKRTVLKGYIEIKTAEGWVREHVHVMQNKPGRKLDGDEVVHHRDEVKSNNCIGNLQLMTHGEHTAYHNKKRYIEKTRGKTMARGINKVILIGNCCSDPEQKSMPNGGTVANVSVATNEEWKDKQTGEKRERAEFHRVVFFGKLAEIAGQYLKKGSKVYIEGQLRTRKWQDKSGQDRYATEVVVDINGQMHMLDSRSDSAAPQQQPQASAASSFDDGENIPF